MTDSDRDRPSDAPLNPALKSQVDKTYDTSSTPAPLDTTAARENEGEGWPVVWLVVTLVCVALTLYLIF